MVRQPDRPVPHSSPSSVPAEGDFRTLVEGAPIGIYRTTPEGRISYANPALLAMLGMADFADLAGRSLETEVALPDQSRSRFRVALERDGLVTGWESAWPRRDGSIIWVRENARVVRLEDGRIRHIEGTIEDITAQREVEAALQRSSEDMAALVDASPVAIVRTDAQGVVTLWNRAAERIFGWTGDEVLGSPWPFISIEGEDEFRSAWQALLAGGAAPPFETRRPRKDGSLAEVAVSAAAIRDADDTVVALIALILDIGERRRVERLYLEAQKLEALGRLAGGVAHDFNNLLQTILSQIEMIRGHLGDPFLANSALQTLAAVAQRGAELSRQLLLFARREEPQTEVLDLADLLRARIAVLRRIVPENVSIVTELGDERLPVAAEAAALDQAVVNLVLNAAAAMPNGGIICITSGCRNDTTIFLEVEDAGPGLSPEERDRIFEPFLHGAEEGSASLSLTLVRGIVISHGGTVEVSSAPGGGSRFTVLLPRSDQVSCPATDKPAGYAPLATLPEGANLRILLVEDEAGARQGLDEVLTMLGYRVTAVGSGEEALAAVQFEHPDVLLTDLLLPGIDGVTLAETLRRDDAELPIVVMSGYTVPRFEQGALADVRCLAKPFDMETVVAVITQALRGRSHATAPATPDFNRP